ncbi:glycosyltransferase family 9 protein [Pseudodesulfovibrio sp. zrk46]|nr:glycosyltransferase family 9 protein [Pseudodesulfovibrio sp. zrk46]
MQRMGDLILSYPLALWLSRKYPGHPIFVAAEKMFYEPLMRVSPAVTYFPWTGTHVLKQHDYELVINLSIQEKAARLADEVKADHKIGPVQSEDGSYFVHGQWQLYRTSLVKNNLYNRYHWAELNAMDVITFEEMARTRFNEPRTHKADKKSVGLFIGASEAAKRPTPKFWAELIRHLLQRGMHPVIFGGPAEVEMGDEVVRLANAPVLNQCGKLGLDEMAAIGQTLSLFITPDTGPMHLAAWTGLRCLNLSMGNVNPWETGPFMPNHYVLRADMECAKGCWQCTRSRLHCHDPFDPKRIAVLASRIIAGDDRNKLAKMRLPGLSFHLTGKKSGLYHLHRLDSEPVDNERYASRFWQDFFAYRFSLFNAFDETRVRGLWQELTDNSPALADELLAHLPKIGRQFTHGLKTGSLRDDTFWADSPAIAKPFTGFVHMGLQNGNYDRAAWKLAMTHLEALIGCCR